MSAAQGRALNFTDMTNFAVKFQTTGGVISAWDVFVDPNLHPNNAGGFPADPFDWQLARIQTASSGVFSPSQLCACPYLDGALTGSFSSQTFNQAGNTTQGQWSDAPAQSEVPEPASLVLLGTGLVFGVARYRKSRTAA